MLDTCILCVWLQVPGMNQCGPAGDCWDYNRVDQKIEQEIKENATLVLPLASIIETGNHISQASHSRRERALELARIMDSVADEMSPWAAFSDQSVLWSPKKIKKLAASWPDLAAQRLSLGDATIKDVAEYYAQAGWQVEILTGDQGLKAYQPAVPLEIPRRRRNRSL